jgi:hypothetical protein
MQQEYYKSPVQERNYTKKPAETLALLAILNPTHNDSDDHELTKSKVS